ncbi:MAG: hypothetical protein CVV27_18625 [Candidatus Melainabacteria bacterium HGW-Melainabacteria-1]|nr:MAG: hypothetical protein CVV27_18625 [Candidatus Melainabacteria bacterium HGW-Melainabacteria-1]
MNHIGRLFLLVLILTLYGCSDDKISLRGHMETLEYEGQTCWIFVDEMHRKYEVITPSPEVLRPNVKMSIRAYPVERKTLCQLPTVIDIVEYRLDFAKDQ